MELLTDDYEQAARLFSICRSHGVQGSAVDLLICAVAIRNDLRVFTEDKDFGHYARFVPVQLYVFPPRAV